MNSNRCPNCGGIATHYMTDIQGENYYRCTNGLTRFERDNKNAISRVSRIMPCDTIIHHGTLFTGTIAYVSDNKIQTVNVI